MPAASAFSPEAEMLEGKLTDVATPTPEGSSLSEKPGTAGSGPTAVETVMVAGAVFPYVVPPSLVVAVMTASPAETPVTTPLLFTVATDVLLELQATVFNVAFAGETVSVSVTVPPTSIVAVVGSRETPVTGVPT